MRKISICCCFEDGRIYPIVSNYLGLRMIKGDNRLAKGWSLVAPFPKEKRFLPALDCPPYIWYSSHLLKRNIFWLDRPDQTALTAHFQVDIREQGDGNAIYFQVATHTQAGSAALHMISNCIFSLQQLTKFNMNDRGTFDHALQIYIQTLSNAIGSSFGI